MKVSQQLPTALFLALASIPLVFSQWGQNRQHSQSRPQLSALSLQSTVTAPSTVDSASTATVASGSTIIGSIPTVASTAIGGPNSLVASTTAGPSLDSTSSTTGSGQWCISLTGNVDYTCQALGGGYTGSCSAGSKICTAGVAPGVTGVVIKLFAAGSSDVGTQIECFFPDPNDASAHPANCDISLVNGYNFDVNCTGGISFGTTPLWKGTSSPYGCTGGGATLGTGTCLNSPAAINTLSDPSKAPPFFLPDNKKGVYIVTAQPGPMIDYPGTTTGDHLTCTISGGIPGGGGKSKRDLGGLAMTNEIEKLGEEHKRGLGGRRHARSLGAVIGGLKG